MSDCIVSLFSGAGGLSLGLRYDLVFVCDTDIPYENTPDRSGEANRDIFQKQIESELVVHRSPFEQNTTDWSSGNVLTQ
jgi:site-specific DNA-cytosine methylase